MVSLPETKMKTHLKREKGSRCLVMEGKHAGSIVKLKDIIERKGGKPNEALVRSGRPRVHHGREVPLRRG